MVTESKPHAVLIPFPAQGHVNPFLKLAKLLHYKGCRITFVNTEYNQRRRLRAGGSDALDGLPEFRFVAIPDGLPPSDADSTQDVMSLCESTSKTCLEPFCELLAEVSPVSVIVSDGAMTFTMQAAERFGLPVALFGTASACAVLGFRQYSSLVERGYIPLKDSSQLTNGFMETIVDNIPGMKDMRLRDLPSFIRTTDPKDFFLNFVIQIMNDISKAKYFIINTFDALETEALNALFSIFPHVYTIGPLQLMMNHIHDERLSPISLSLWKEDSECIKWLNTQHPSSVVYVNFGSVTVMTADQLTEFAWGLANCKHPFLWIVRPDILSGETAILPPDFVTDTKNRGMLISWCPQEEVLQHPATGGCLIHSGWNSTIECIAGGLPVICWPFFADQQTNCRYSCVEWEMGMEIDSDVKRDEVEALVRELMEGNKGKRMKKKALEWKRKAREATAEGGPSYVNLDKLMNEVMLVP